MNKKRVMLIQPPYSIPDSIYKICQPPLGLAYIAAVLLEAGYEVKILDALVEGWDNITSEGRGNYRYGLSFAHIEERIKDFAPDVIGVSCLFSLQMKNVHTICKIVKSIDKNIITVVGGQHPSSAPEDVLEDDNIDLIVIGEGEYTMLDLIQRLDSGIYDFSSIDGLVYRYKGQIVLNKKDRFIEDLDQLPFPARKLLPMDRYFRINRPHGITSMSSPNTSMITSRGCPMHCVFCSNHTIWGRKFRTRSPQNVIKEIEYLTEVYGIKEIQFEDDNLTLDKKRAIQIFDLMLQKKLNVHWSTPNGIAVWALDEDVLLKMKNSGCYRIIIGIESGDQHILDSVIKKPVKLEQVPPLINAAKKIGLEVGAFFVVGLPGENKEQINKTFRLAKKLDIDYATFSIARPHPGSWLYDICKNKGYIEKQFNFEDTAVEATIETPEFTSHWIERKVARETLLFQLSLFRKKPFHFFKVLIIRFIFKDPLFFFHYAYLQLKELIVENRNDS